MNDKKNSLEVEIRILIKMNSDVFLRANEQNICLYGQLTIINDVLLVWYSILVYPVGWELVCHQERKYLQDKRICSTKETDNFFSRYTCNYSVDGDTRILK